ncbi:MAG TPA: sodium:solute symporter [Steroidobacteraceae bacterium]|jgi:SSS family solute:Na+ symporter
MDLTVIAIYMLAMIGVGWYAKRRARTESDFLVAGRRLGPVLYAGTMAALVMGGGATVGGVGLGYQYGISGMWLVFNMALGVLLISVALAARISRLRVYTVSQMLELRYGPGSSLLSGTVMFCYTLMIAVTSTIAYGSIFAVLFDFGKIPAILIGGGVVVLYSTMGGMWSITLTDFVQFLVKTVGMFAILLPIALMRAGGFEGLHANLPATAFSLTHIGVGTIFTYFFLYVFTMVIGQDLWQRVFTARSDRVAKWAGTAAALYGICYAVAGAIIGMSAKVLLPAIADRDHVYTEIVRHTLPAGLAGLVVAGALSAVMSTSSGALIATATVFKEDIMAVIRRRRAEIANAANGSVHSSVASHPEADEVSSSRGHILRFGLLMIVIACVLQDVIAGLTIAGAILVGGLLVSIIGGMVWQRGTLRGAVASIVSGVVLTLGTMVVMRDIYANLPIFLGLAGSLLSYLVVSLLDKPTSAAILREWNSRSSPEQVPVGAMTEQDAKDSAYRTTG